MTRRGRAFSTSRSATSRLVACFALLAFLLQGFALQTHIHQQIQPVIAKLAAPDSQAGLPAARLLDQQPRKTNDPLDQGHCRLCHELVHAGSYVTPTALALAAGLDWITARIPAPARVFGTSAQAFAWQSRGPPQH